MNIPGCTCRNNTRELCPQCQVYLELAGENTLAPRQEPEQEFQARVRQIATECGWLVYHTRDARGSDKGFPDLVLVRGPSATQRHGRLIFAELKTQKGKLTQEQAWWLKLLASVLGVEQYLWRPADWPSILTLLTGQAPQRQG